MSTPAKKSEYVGIKVKGMDAWFWFKNKAITETSTDFTGVEGWGEGGTYIEKFSVNNELIEGRIESAHPHYND